MVLFDAVENADASALIFDAYPGGPNSLTYDAGDFLLSILYTRDTTSGSPSQTSGVWDGDLSTFVGTFTSPYRFLFGNERRRADFSSDDALTWEWLTSDVEASSLVLAAHGRYEHWQSDYDDNADATVDISVGSAEGAVTVLYLLSSTGTTEASADLLIRTDETLMPAGHGCLEAWAFQGPGPHTVNADALTGTIAFYYWVELKAAASRWTVGRVRWGPNPGRWH